ncbi:MAG TPA: TIGR02757 family protein [Flavitalea sp.]|nr:TIGR02757 family protein [Flavitalea sp.]
MNQNKVERDALKEFLDRKVIESDHPSFIPTDPVSIPHLFKNKSDREIAGFFASIFAWGHRTTIISKTRLLMQLMDMAPHDFICNHGKEDLKKLLSFKHRTFNATDLLYFVSFLHHHYSSGESLSTAFTRYMKPSDRDITNALNGFYKYFFSLEDVPYRTRKHIATPEKKATCKRLNMFLRWMVRRNSAVDFGIWRTIHPSQLICPIDIHVGRVAKKFGLLQRKQTDWQAAVELTEALRMMNPKDPVAYDFALFSLGANERF